MSHDKIGSMNASETSALEKLDSLAEKMDTRFDSLIRTVNTRFEAVDEKFDSMLELMMSGFEVVCARFDHVDQEIHDVKTRVVRLEDSMDEVKYSAEVLTGAEEKDAESSINHEERIQRLEKINKIKAIPPSHLIDIQA